MLHGVTGSSYPDLVAAEFAARGAKAVTTRAVADDTLVGGHRYVLGTPVRTSTGYDDLGLAYGYLGGSVADLAAIGRSVAADLADPASACDPAVLATTVDNDPAADGYALGWRVATWQGHRVLWHGGAVDGYATFLAVLPASGQVVAAVQDAYGPLHDERLMAASLDAVGVLIGQPTTGAELPSVYRAFAALLAVLTVTLGVLALRPPRGRNGALLRSILGLVAVAGAMLVPTLTGTGSWAVALRWIPDLTVGAVVVGGLGLVLVLRAALCVRGRSRLTE